MSKGLKFGLLLGTIVAMGFIRDFFFDNINWIYLHKTIERPNQAVDFFDFLLNWTVPEIDRLKWILTGLFFLIFMSLTLLIIHLIFAQKFFNRIVIATFCGLLLLSLLFYGLALISGKFSEFYAVVLTLMHLAQSFVPLLVFCVFFRFFPKSTGK